MRRLLNPLRSAEPRGNFSGKRAKFNSGTTLALIGTQLPGRFIEVVMHRSFPRLWIIAICSSLCFAAAMRDVAKAVDFGWKELPGGGIEYQVQVEPELISTFEKQGFSSEIPAGLRDIRAIRITTGRITL